MKLTTIFALSIVFLVSSCSLSPSKDSGVTEILIKNGSVNNAYDISDKIVDIQIIPLKESMGNYIGDAYKIFYVNNQYVIFDHVNTHKINLYDQDGKFLKNIIQVGDGPNDALAIVDCWLNEKKELEVYEYAQKKIYQYDSSYNLKHVIKSIEPSFFNNIVKITGTNNYMAYANYNNYNNSKTGKYFRFVLLDSSLRIINTYLPFEKKYLGVNLLNFTNTFYQYKENTLFTYPYSNYIYSIEDRKLKEKYKMVYENNSLPEDFLKEIVGNHLSLFMDRDGRPDEKIAYFKKYSYFYGAWMETAKHIYVKSMNKNFSPFVSWIDKKSMSVLGTGKLLSETHRFKMSLPYFKSFDPGSNCFISVANGSDIKKFLLMKGSPFLPKVISSQEQLYIIKVKIKE